MPLWLGGIIRRLEGAGVEIALLGTVKGSLSELKVVFCPSLVLRPVLALLYGFEVAIVKDKEDGAVPTDPIALGETSSKLRVTMFGKPPMLCASENDLSAALSTWSAFVGEVLSCFVVTDTVVVVKMTFVKVIMLVCLFAVVSLALGFVVATVVDSAGTTTGRALSEIYRTTEGKSLRAARCQSRIPIPVDNAAARYCC